MTQILLLLLQLKMNVGQRHAILSVKDMTFKANVLPFLEKSQTE